MLFFLRMPFTTLVSFSGDVDVMDIEESPTQHLFGNNFSAFFVILDELLVFLTLLREETLLCRVVTDDIPDDRFALLLR